MRHGIIADFPADIVQSVPTDYMQLVTEDNSTPAVSTPMTVTFDPGPEHPLRWFYVLFTNGRATSTTSADATSVVFDGITLPQRRVGANTNAYLSLSACVVDYPTGIGSKNLVLTPPTSYQIRGVRIFRFVGVRMTNHTVIAANNVPLSVPINGEEHAPNFLLGSVIGPTTDTDMFDDSWLTQIGTDLDYAVNSINRRSQAAVGIVPIGEAAWEKSGNVYRAAQSLRFTPVTDTKELLLIPRTDVLWYHFDVGRGAYSDAGVTLCDNNDGVRQLKNFGTKEVANQSTSARRPTFKTGGVNGLPYLQCNRTTQQYFDDLQAGQASSTSGTPYTVAAVWELTDLSADQPILGSTAASRKTAFYTTTAGNIIIFKANHTLAGAASASVLLICVAAHEDVDDAFFYFNDVYTNAGTNASASVSTLTTTPFLRDPGVGPTYFHGKLYELLYWRTALPEFDQFAVYRALKRKYT